MKECLDKTIENKIIAVGNKRYYRVLVLTGAWIVIVIISWLTFMIFANRSFLAMPNYLPLALCFLSFFAHKTLSSKTFYATVNYTVDSVFQNPLDIY